MTPAPYSVQRSHSLGVARKMMQDKHIRHMPVLESGKVIGLLTEARLLEAFVSGHDEHAQLGQVELEIPYLVPGTTPFLEVVQAMAKDRREAALVVENGRVAGVFTAVDAVRVLAELLATRPVERD